MDVTPEHPDPEVSSASTGEPKNLSKRLRSENVGRGAFEQLEQLGGKMREDFFNETHGKIWITSEATHHFLMDRIRLKEAKQLRER